MYATSLNERMRLQMSSSKSNKSQVLRICDPVERIQIYHDPSSQQEIGKTRGSLSPKALDIQWRKPSPSYGYTTISSYLKIGRTC